MNIRLSDHFGYRRLLRFTLPSIAMMIFTSIYGVVDGLFVSNFVGKTPFAAVNLIMPFLMVLGVLGFMFGSGGCALIARMLGEGKKDKANQTFSMLIAVTVLCGVVLAALGIAFLPPIARLLGAQDGLLELCVRYGRISLLALPALMLQYEFQSFLIAAEKPNLGLAVTVASGVTNMALDALFIAGFGWGVAGAAAATAMSQVVGGMVPLAYFARRNDSLLRLVRPVFDGRALVKTCTNGSSELMSNISMSLVSMLYNVQLMRYAGEDGVAAYGVLMYVNFIFLAAFIGYANGSAPVLSFHYGADNRDEMRSIRKKSLVIIAAFSLGMFACSELLARPLAAIFVSYDAALMALTVRAFKIYSLSFLFAGAAIYGSSFFTALGDGLTSALISFVRTLLLQTSAVILLPLILGIDGVWWSIVAAEAAAALLTAAFLKGKQKQYGY
ncbi:MAG: MATE family efflux transporter [Candidatus Ventricola sp.]